MVEFNKISSHAKTRQGVSYAKSNSTNRTVKGNSQYVIKYGKGSKRISETLHCSEDAIKAYQDKLQKAGW